MYNFYLISTKCGIIFCEGCDKMREINLSIIRNNLPIRNKLCHKNSFGHLFLVGGNRQLGGAIIIAAVAALASGASLITVISDQLNLSSIHARSPEVMFISIADFERMLLRRGEHTKTLKKMTTLLLGPGLGENSQILEHIFSCLSIRGFLNLKNFVLDADALNYLSKHQEIFNKLPKPYILTPHIGEFNRLTENKINPNDYQAVSDWVIDKGCFLVLKSEETKIFTPEGSIWKNPFGNPGMAMAGMGDALAGMIAAFLTQFEETEIAIISAVGLHSYIADQLYNDFYTVRPTAIIHNISQVLKDVSKNKY